jgi:hypothetical protein
MSVIDQISHGDIILSFDGKTSKIEILKVGTIHDRGLKITEDMLNDFVKNFDEGVYGTEIQVNLGHVREGEAAGWIKSLSIQDGKLFAHVEWTPLGQEKISSKQFRYTSSELALSYTHPTTGDKVKNVLIGVALTNIPAVKGMAPVELSENLLIHLNQEQNMSKAKSMYAELEKKDSISEKEFESFEEACADMPEDEKTPMMKALKSKLKKEDKKMSEELKEKVSTEGTVSLAEFAAEKARNIKLQEKIDRLELNGVVDEKLILSEKVETGFSPAQKEAVVSFMLSLNEEQRDSFIELMGTVAHADLSVKGTGEGDVEAKGTQAEEDKKLEAAEAEAKELSQKEGIPLHEALSQRYKAHGLGGK